MLRNLGYVQNICAEISDNDVANPKKVHQEWTFFS